MSYLLLVLLYYPEQWQKTRFGGILEGGTHVPIKIVKFGRILKSSTGYEILKCGLYLGQRSWKKVQYLRFKYEIHKLKMWYTQRHDLTESVFYKRQESSSNCLKLAVWCNYIHLFIVSLLLSNLCYTIFCSDP